MTDAGAPPQQYGYSLVEIPIPTSNAHMPMSPPRSTNPNMYANLSPDDSDTDPNCPDPPCPDCPDEVYPPQCESGSARKKARRMAKVAKWKSLKFETKMKRDDDMMALNEACDLA